MTQAEQFIKEKYGVPIESLKLNTQEMFHLMDNFVYEELKKLTIKVSDSYPKAGSMLTRVKEAKEKFHQT